MSKSISINWFWVGWIVTYSTYFGGSFITDAWGRILAEAGEKECVLIGEIDLEEAKEMRKATSIFEDRRPELYWVDINSYPINEHEILRITVANKWKCCRLEDFHDESI